MKAKSYQLVADLMSIIRNVRKQVNDLPVSMEMTWLHDVPTAIYPLTVITEKCKCNVKCNGKQFA